MNDPHIAPVHLAMRTYPLMLKVNGHERTVDTAPFVTLLDLLREQLRLTGAKKGCDHGQCGACTVLVDGKRINSCLKLAVTLPEGAAITTVEGLASDGELSPLQQAFIDRDAFQCGYCTPGQLCSATALLGEGIACSRDEVREYMSGNLCRCGAYTNITDAVMDVLGQAASAGANTEGQIAPLLDPSESPRTTEWSTSAAPDVATPMSQATNAPSEAVPTGSAAKRTAQADASSSPGTDPLSGSVPHASTSTQPTQGDAP